jgi:hypothetical protein
MTKEQLLNALRFTDEEQKPLTECWDEFVTIFALISNATEEQLKQAWAEVSEI